MPDDFDDLFNEALEEAERRARERGERDDTKELDKLLQEQKEAIGRYVSEQRENTYVSLDPEDVKEYEDAGFRGLFFSLEDALEYAKDIPENIPVMIVQSSDGYTVVVMY